MIFFAPVLAHKKHNQDLGRGHTLETTVSHYHGTRLCLSAMGSDLRRAGDEVAQTMEVLSCARR